jgi:long-chain acyl-CoA synthetase
MTTNQIFLDERSTGCEAVLANAARAATGLDALGVREGDAVALLLRNDFAFIEATQACALLGAYCVPINWHGNADDVSYILDDVKAKVLIAHAGLIAPLRGRLPPGLTVLVVPTPIEVEVELGKAGGLMPDDTLWHDWLSAHALWAGEPKRSRATLIYTSGTTGRPKGVKRQPATPEQAGAYAELMRTVYGVTKGCRVLIGGPLYHASPNACLRQAIAQAEIMLLQSKFDAERTLAAIERHRITHAVMVPTMFIRLVKLPQEIRRRYDVSSLQWIIHTGAPCPPEIKAELMAWWGPVIYETYGGTEVGAVMLSTPQDWLAHPGSVGQLTPGARIAIYGDDGVPVAPGGVGEIFVRQPALADFTYLNQDEKRRQIERDGLISVGDVGYERSPVFVRPPFRHGDQRRRQHLPFRNRAGAGAVSRRQGLRGIWYSGCGSRRNADGRRRTGAGRGDQHRGRKSISCAAYREIQNPEEHQVPGLAAARREREDFQASTARSILEFYRPSYLANVYSCLAVLCSCRFDNDRRGRSTSWKLISRLSWRHGWTN